MKIPNYLTDFFDTISDRIEYFNLNTDYGTRMFIKRIKISDYSCMFLYEIHEGGFMVKIGSIILDFASKEVQIITTGWWDCRFIHIEKSLKEFLK